MPLIEFDTQEEYDEFLKWVNSPKKDNTPEMQKARKVIEAARNRRKNIEIEKGED